MGRSWRWPHGDVLSAATPTLRPAASRAEKARPWICSFPMFVLGFLGFGVKAAIFPFHDWLPAASVAPTPVTALLHAVAVVKAGAFAVIRLSHYCFSPDLMRGTWAQTVCLIVAMFSIVFGSAMAVRERHMKRRLAYSTMSNLSYVLLGALMLTPRRAAGRTASHGVSRHHEDLPVQLRGRDDDPYRQELCRRDARHEPRDASPWRCSCSAASSWWASRPFCGLQSKWALATAALGANGALGVAAVVVLIVSAALTSIYMLAPAVSASRCRSARIRGLRARGWTRLAHAAAADSAGDRHADSGVCLRAAGRVSGPGGGGACVRRCGYERFPDTVDSGRRPHAVRAAGVGAGPQGRPARHRGDGRLLGGRGGGADLAHGAGRGRKRAAADLGGASWAWASACGRTVFRALYAMIASVMWSWLRR